MTTIMMNTNKKILNSKELVKYLKDSVPKTNTIQESDKENNTDDSEDDQYKFKEAQFRPKLDNSDHLDVYIVT